jgi:hypothetical protein
VRRVQSYQYGRTSLMEKENEWPDRSPGTSTRVSSTEYIGVHTISPVFLSFLTRMSQNNSLPSRANVTNWFDSFSPVCREHHKPIGCYVSVREKEREDQIQIRLFIPRVVQRPYGKLARTLRA